MFVNIRYSNNNRAAWPLRQGEEDESKDLQRKITCLATSPLVAAIAGCGGTITLPGLNQSPTANAGADQTTDVGQRVTLDGLGSTDPDDDPLTFSWQQRSGPAVMLGRVAHVL